MTHFLQCLARQCATFYFIQFVFGKALSPRAPRTPRRGVPTCWDVPQAGLTHYLQGSIPNIFSSGALPLGESDVDFSPFADIGAIQNHPTGWRMNGALDAWMIGFYTQLSIN